MDEGINIIDTIESVALQSKPRDRDLDYGVVVVINNRPDASQGVLESNMKTYTLLQGIRHGCKLSVRGNPKIAEKVRRIQESGMRIEIVDAFSEGHAHTESNVGRARKVGTEHALDIIKEDRSAIVSTDADTVLGPHALRTLYDVFEKEDVDATPLELGRKIDDLDSQSKKAYQRYALSWHIQHTVQVVPKKTAALQSDGLPYALRDLSKTGDSAVWLSGGGTAFAADAYRRSTGYRTIGREEDTLLAADLSKSGGRIKDMTMQYPLLVAYTRPRISLRTERGFGHTISDWDKPGTPFGSMPIEHPQTLIRVADFYKKIDPLLEHKTSEMSPTQNTEFLELCSSSGIQEHNALSLLQIFEKWDGAPSREEHFRFMGEVRNIFAKDSPGFTMVEMVELAEKENAAYSKAAHEVQWGGFNIGPRHEEIWGWEQYRENARGLLAEVGIVPHEPDMEIAMCSIVASEYVSHFEPYVQFWISTCANVMQQTVRSRGPMTDQEKEFVEIGKALSLDRFTPEESYRVMLLQECAVKMQILERALSAVDDSITTESRKRIDRKIEGLRSAYDDIANAIITAPSKPEKT